MSGDGCRETKKRPPARGGPSQTRPPAGAGGGGSIGEVDRTSGGGRYDQAILVTFAAAAPLAPCTTSNSTRSPSARLLKPSPWIAEWWTKQSLLPSSGVMNPKPLASLNHLTLPVLRILLFSLSLAKKTQGPGCDQALCVVLWLIAGEPTVGT